MPFGIGKDVLYASILSRIQVQTRMILTGSTVDVAREVIPVTLLSPLSPSEKGCKRPVHRHFVTLSPLNKKILVSNDEKITNHLIHPFSSSSLSAQPLRLSVSAREKTTVGKLSDLTFMLAESIIVFSLRVFIKHFNFLRTTICYFPKKCYLCSCYNLKEA